jgi:excisionase family DNA binding protein
MKKLDFIRTSKEVAKILNCTQRTVSNLVKNQKIKPISILENGSFLFNTADIESYKSQTTKK